MKRLRQNLAAFAVLVPLSGCSAAQLQAWADWHASDPQAAVAFAQQPEIVADLARGEHEADTAGQPTPGDCESYWPLMQAHGLPRVFVRIAYRESRCDHTRFTDDHDDLGGYLLGINFRNATLRAGWARWCGGTVSNLRYDADHQIACAAEAYQRLGMRPWS